MCYGDGPIEYYAAHRLLVSQQVYFRIKQKGPLATYEPRPLSQVYWLPVVKVYAVRKVRVYTDYSTVECCIQSKFRCLLGMHIYALSVSNLVCGDCLGT